MDMIVRLPEDHSKWEQKEGFEGPQFTASGRVLYREVDTQRFWDPVEGSWLNESDVQEEQERLDAIIEQKRREIEERVAKRGTPHHDSVDR